MWGPIPASLFGQPGSVASLFTANVQASKNILLRIMSSGFDGPLPNTVSTAVVKGPSSVCLSVGQAFGLVAFLTWPKNNSVAS